MALKQKEGPKSPPEPKRETSPQNADKGASWGSVPLLETQKERAEGFNDRRRKMKRKPRLQGTYLHTEIQKVFFLVLCNDYSNLKVLYYVITILTIHTVYNKHKPKSVFILYFCIIPCHRCRQQSVCIHTSPPDGSVQRISIRQAALQGVSFHALTFHL